MSSLTRFAKTMPCLAALLAGCAQPGADGVAWDRKAAPPTIAPLVVDGRCALVVSGTANFGNNAIGRIGLDVFEGIAQINLAAARPDAHSSTTFHIVVPIEEQHVDVIYIGQPRTPIWERAAGGRTCAA